MRVSAYNTSIGVASASRRLTELLATPTPSLPDRYPDRPRRDMPDVVRVVEGELLRPAPAPDSLLANYRASAISAQSHRVDTPDLPTESRRSKPSTVLFYQLHSSNEILATQPLGHTVNQYV